MVHLSQEIQSRIEAKVKKLNTKRPLSKAIVKKLREQFALEMTYNSNAIEGNRLTLKETFLVINEGITIKGKSLKDHLEAKNHNEALHYLYDLVDQNKRHTISEHMVRSLQQLTVAESEPEIAGTYRTENVFITGSRHTPPEAFDVPNEMKKLLKWISSNLNKIHPVELAAIAHHKLVHIHPFTDGNGRTARLIMNLLLMQKGYPLVVILKNDRKKYYDALEKADFNDPKPFITFIAQAVERSLNIYLKTLFPERSSSKKYLPLSKIAPKTPYSVKYLNLLVRQGKLEAHKEGRIWVSTVEAVDNYIKGRERKRKT